MKLPASRLRMSVMGSALILLCLSIPRLPAQVRASATTQSETTAETSAKAVEFHQGSTAQARAELVKGKLSPVKSKPGDKVFLELKEDAKSEGQLLLKKGSKMEGVIKNVKTFEVVKGESAGQTRSMVEIEWLWPPTGSQASQALIIAVQSIVQVSPLHREGPEDKFPSMATTRSATTSTTGSSTGLGTGVLGSATQAVGATVSAVGGVTAASTGSIPTSVSGTASSIASGAAVIRPEPVDAQVAQRLSNDLGFSATGQLYRVGRGELVTAGGSRHSLDLFSQMKNDTILTSASKRFEVANGAEMQLFIARTKK